MNEPWPETPEAVSDEMLVAYLDGELPGEVRARLDDWIAASAELEDRLAALTVDGAPMAEAFDLLLVEARARVDVDAVLAEATAGADRAHAPAERGFWRRAAGWVVAAHLAGAGLGYGVGELQPDPPPPARGWLATAADYLTLYTADTLAGGPSARSIDALAAIDAEFDLELDLDALRAAGLEFRQAQLLEFNGKPLAQIMFVDATQTVIALCVIASAAEDRGPVSATMSGLGAMHWVDDGRGLVVFGGSEPAALERAVRVVRGAAV